jgi:hypothetical protein
MNQIVYVLTNDAMPWYVKIGKTTTSLEQRIAELSRSTSIPFPFTCFYAAIVNDCDFVERQLHEAFGDNRVNPRREFFEIDPERVVAALKLATIQEITIWWDVIEEQEDQKALDEVREKLATFNFEMVKIPIGSELYFSRNPEKKARVLNNRWIEFEWKETSLSEAARQILGYSRKPQWTQYWMYDGDTLSERRNKMENERV